MMVDQMAQEMLVMDLEADLQEIAQEMMGTQAEAATPGSPGVAPPAVDAAVLRELREAWRSRQNTPDLQEARGAGETRGPREVQWPPPSVQPAPRLRWPRARRGWLGTLRDAFHGVGPAMIAPAPPDGRTAR